MDQPLILVGLLGLSVGFYVDLVCLMGLGLLGRLMLLDLDLKFLDLYHMGLKLVIIKFHIKDTFGVNIVGKMDTQNIYVGKYIENLCIENQDNTTIIKVVVIKPDYQTYKLHKEKHTSSGTFNS